MGGVRLGIEIVNRLKGVLRVVDNYVFFFLDCGLKIKLICF